MNVSQYDALVATLERIAASLEKVVQSQPATIDAVTPTNPYASANVPEGYDTVLGYFSKTDPEALDLLSDPVVDTLRDDHWLLHQANRREIRVAKVSAPAAMKEFGIEMINTYPLALLKERLGG